MAAQERLYSDYGGFCFVILRGTDIDYHNRTVAHKILRLYAELTTNDYASRSDCWLEDFVSVVRLSSNTSRYTFLRQLKQFLLQPKYSKYRSDILFDDDNSSSGAIIATKMIIRLRNIGMQNDTIRAKMLRSIFDAYGFNGFVYDTSFLVMVHLLILIYIILF